MSPRLRRLLAFFAPAACAVGVVVACTPSIGDKCNISTDCSQLGDRLCDSSQPGGYCTVFNCEPDTCLNAICVAFNPTLDPACGAATSGQWPRFERTFCLAPCKSTGDCRDQYDCVDLSIAANQTARAAQVVDLGAGDGGLGYAVCMASTCTDNVLDGAETDVDCGGNICNACPDKKHCSSGTDCLSSTCVAAICVDPTCTDGVMNNMETDVDCGGPQCQLCHSGQKCAVGSDCTSGVCGANNASGICGPGDCHDGVQDGTETDVDCGGGCTPCLVAQKCSTNTDCATSNCKSGTCAPAPIPEVCLVPDAGPFSDAGPTPYMPDAGWTGPLNDGG